MITTQNINPWDAFLQWDKSSRDLIIIKKIYIDITNSLNAGILLDQIIYWNLPSRNSEIESKLRIWKNGELWLAKRREDWWDEIRLTPKQYDGAVKILKRLNIVRTEVFKFNGDPTTHIALNKDILLELLGEHKNQSIKVQKQAENADEPPETPMDSGYSPLGNNEMPQRGIRKSTRGEEPITKITTKTTTEFSKENSSISKRNAQKTKNLNQNESLISTDSGQNSDKNKTIECKPKSQVLRSSAKTVKLPSNKRRPTITPKECPPEYEPYLEVWEKYTGRLFRDVNGSYTKSWIAIKKAVNGKLFNSTKTPLVPEIYYGEKLTMEDWIFAVKRFSLIRNNSNYEPADKKNVKSIDPEKFLYNIFGKQSYLPSMSYFVYCLENEPEQIKGNTIKDPNPEYTDQVIEICKKEFGWDFSNGGRSTAIRCTSKLLDFYSKNEDRIINYDYHYKFPYQQIGELVSALKRNASESNPPKPIYLYGDVTYRNILPEHLKRVGSMS